MPELLSVEQKFLPPGVPSCPTDATYSSPVITELESVNATPAVRRHPLGLPERACRWLADRLSLRSGSPLAQANLTAKSLEAEEECFLQQQVKDNRACSAPGITLTVVSLAAFGLLGTTLYSRRTASAGDTAVDSNMTMMQSAQYGLPYAAAVVGSPPLLMPVTWSEPLLKRVQDHVLTRFPGIRPDAVSALLIDPLTTLLRESLGGKSPNADQQRQLSMLVDVLLSTLTTPEYLLLYRHERMPADRIEILKRFIAWDGYFYVRIGRQGFLLRAMADGTPYVVDKDGRLHFIRFNQRQLAWEYVPERDNLAYSAHNRDWGTQLGMSLAKLPPDARVIFDVNEDLVNITTPGKPYRQGLFIGGRFVPVATAEHFSKPLTGPKPRPRSVCHPPMGQRTITKTDYGWVFERPTAKMDESLIHLLENKYRCINTLPENPLQGIREGDGLCTDPLGLKFIKKDAHYFNVDYLYDPQTGRDYLTLTDFPGSFIQYKNGVMLLKRAEDSLSALGSVKAKGAFPSVAPFNSEKDLLRYLQLYGFISSAKAVRALPFPGLSTGHDGTLIFTLNEDNYAVREYADDEIRIRHVDAPFQRQNDILLRAIGDTVLRVRPGNSTVALTVSPASHLYPSATLPVVIETELRQLLEKNTVASHSLPDPQNLRQKQRFTLPLLWTDSRDGKDYFSYNNKYYPARFIAAGSATNPVGVDCLKVYGNGDFYHSRKLITPLVVDRKNQRIEIKTPETYLAEKANVSKAMAAAYINRFPWRYKNIALAETAAGIANAMENYYVAPAPAPRVIKKLPANLNSAARELYPGRNEESKLNLFRLNDNHTPRTTDEKALQHRVQNTLQRLRKYILSPLENALYYDSSSWPAIKYYLDEATAIASNEFQSAFAFAWRKRLHTINQRLNEDNIFLVGGRTLQLSADEKARDPVAFFSQQDGNLYISTHKIDPDDKAQIRLTSALMQVMANASGMASDIITIRNNNGIYLPLKDAQERIVGNMMKKRLSRSQLENLQAVSQRYMKNNPAWKQLSNKPLKPEQAAWLTRFDPAYRAHLMLSSDSLLTLLSLDSRYLLALARNRTATDAWASAWGALRAGEQAGEKKEKESDLIHFHLPHHHNIKTSSRQPANNPNANRDNSPGQSEENSDDDRSSQVESSETGSEVSTEDYEEWSDTDSATSLDTEYDELTDSSSAESQETESEELTDSSSAESQDTESEELTDSSSAESQETESEELTDSSSAESRQTEEEEFTDSDTDTLSRSDTLSSPLSSPALPVPIPPIHPVALPPMPNELPAQIVAAATLGAGGAWLAASAPELPAIRPPVLNTTTARPARRTTTTTAPHGHQSKYFRQPQDETKNSRQPWAPDSHDDVFIGNERTGSGRGIESKVFVPGHGMVTAIELPEYACLGEKEVSIAQILRWAGETLQAPLTKNLEAWQELYHIEVQGQDCPTEESVQRLQSLARPVDMAINTAMSFSKVFLPVVILQNVVGPALILAADILDEKSNEEIIENDLIDIFEQTLGAMRVELSTLKGPEMAPLPPEKVTIDRNTPFKKRFTYTKDGRIYVNVDAKDYPVQTTHDEIPLVINDDGYTRIIDYSHIHEKWNFIHPDGKKLRLEGHKNQQIHKATLSEIIKETNIDVNENDVCTIKLNNKEEISGVYTGMNFIPARETNIGNDIVAYTSNNDRSGGMSRLLVRDEYGWYFEQPSVEKDEYLKVLLATKDAGYDAEEVRCGPIQKDGLSYDRHDNAYIKHDYNYYKVDKTSHHTTDAIITLPNYDDAVVKFNKNRFILVSHDKGFLDSKFTSVADRKGSFYIEEGTVRFLREYGKEVIHPLTERVGPGLYTDFSRTNTVFTINHNNFQVSEYAPDEMHLTSFGGNSRHKYWLDDDTWLRIRDEPAEPAFDYQELVPCRQARSPHADSSCMGVLIEEELARHLERQVQEEMASDRAPEPDRLRKVRQDDIPLLYHDAHANRYYFHYAGKYFNAEIIESRNKLENPTGFPCLKVTGRSDFMHAEKKIATIVMQRYAGNIKMVSLSTYIAEKLNISEEEAILYLKKRPWKRLAEIKDLEQLMDNLRQADNLYISQPPESLQFFGKKLSSGSIASGVTKALFPEHITTNRNYHIHTYDGDTATSQLAPYYREGIDAINRKVDYLRDTLLPGVIDSLSPESQDHSIVEDYFIENLKKDTPNFLNDFERSFSSRLRIAEEELHKRKLKIMTVQSLADGSNPTYPREAGNVVYIHANDPENIYINLDQTDTGTNAQQMPLKELTGAILSEVLRATQAAAFSCKLPRKQGIFLNAKDAWQFLQQKYLSGNFKDDVINNLHQKVESYVLGSAEHLTYRNKLSDISTNRHKFHFLLENDPGARAQIALNADDFITLYTQDLHYLISVSKNDWAILHPWVKGYGLRRKVLSFAAVNEHPTDILISPDKNIDQLLPSYVTEHVLDSVSGQTNIFTGQNNNLYYKYAGKFYPANFLGTSGRIVALGEEGGTRQAYYYHPQSGAVTPIREPRARLNVLKYCKEADLFESLTPGFDFSEVLRFDESQGKLMPTGAMRLTRLPGKVTRLEYPSFNLYLPQGAPKDIYVMGHGQNLVAKSKLPENVYVTYYTSDGQALFPYRGNGDDLLSGKLVPVEALSPGEEMGVSAITDFVGAKVNHYHLAKHYNKNFIQLLTTPTRSTDLINAAAKLYPEGPAELHLYTCRTAEKSPSIIAASKPAPAGSNKPGVYYYAQQPSARWTFDQQIEGEALNADRALQSFLPLKEVNTFFHFNTVENLIEQGINSVFSSKPYDIYYGLNISPEAQLRTPAYVFPTRAKLLTNVDKARTSLAKAQAKLNNKAFNGRVRDYLSYAFDNTDENVLNKVKGRLKLMMARVANFLEDSVDKDYSNFAIISTRQTPDPVVPGGYRSLITNEEARANLPSAFMVPGDPYRRVFFINDSYYPTSVKDTLVDFKNMRQEHTILHESSHIVGNTLDISYIRITPADFVHKEFNLLDAQLGLKQINELIERGKITDNSLWSDFRPMMNQYFKPEKPFNEATVRKMLQEDHMLKANLITANADSFAVFVKHIANLELTGRRKRETDDAGTGADDKFLALFFALAKDHYIYNIE